MTHSYDIHQDSEELRLIPIGADDIDGLDEGELRRIGIGEGQVSSAETLLEALGDSDWRVRREAAWTLGEIGGAEIATDLIGLLDSENPGQRNAAMKTLIKCGEDSVEPMLAALEHPDADMRILLAVTIGQVGSGQATVPLMSVLEQEEDPNVQYMLIEALGRIGDARSLPMLLGLLDEDPWLAAPAARALGQLANLEATERLAPLLRDDVLGGVAAESLGVLADIRALLPLHERAREASRAVARAFVDAIGATVLSHEGDLENVLSILRSYASPPTEVMIEAARTLLAADSVDDRRRGLAAAYWLDEASLGRQVAEMPQDSATARAASELLCTWWPQLRQDVCSGDMPASSAVLDIISRVGSDEDRTTVLSCLGDSNPSVRTDALHALAALGWIDEASRAMALLDDQIEDVRVVAAEVVGRLDMSVALDVLPVLADSGRAEDGVVASTLIAFGIDHPEHLKLEIADDISTVAVRLAHHSDAATRSIIAFPMATLGSDCALLISLAGDEDRAVRLAATRALGDCRDALGRSHLRTLADSHDPEVALTAVRSLSRSATLAEEDLVVLRGCGDSEDPRMRIAVLEGITRVGASEDAAYAARQAGDSVPDVRKAAIEALAKCAPEQSSEAVRAALADDEWVVRMAALEHIEVLAESERTEAVEHLISDEEELVVRAAVENSPALLGDEAEQILLEALHSPSAASTALGLLVKAGPKTLSRVATEIASAATVTGHTVSSVLVGEASEEVRAIFESEIAQDDSYRRWMAVLALSVDKERIEDLRRLRSGEGSHLVRCLLKAVLVDEGECEFR